MDRAFNHYFSKYPKIIESGPVYVPIVEQTARDHGVPFKAIRLESKTEAQNAPTPVTTYALFYNGEYLTNEQMNEARFLKLLAK